MELNGINKVLSGSLKTKVLVLRMQSCIYRSELYKKLSTESTKYWHLGPVDLYEELRMEL